jgi:biopolymer transport protein TolQ
MKEILLFLSVGASTSGSKGLDYFAIIGNASFVVKLALVILLFFSIMSWAIIIFKMLEYSNAKKSSGSFLRIFRTRKNFSEILRYANEKDHCPLSDIFREGYKELSMQLSDNTGPESNKEIKTDRIERALLRASNLQILKFERLNGFIATTAAAAPFIGLFGTVWGIMQAFHDIGRTGTANLATVAPGIAEALIATALGLFAAIPAVIFYNYLLNKLRGLIGILENFANEFINISERLN